MDSTAPDTRESSTARPDNLHLLLSAIRLYGYHHPGVNLAPHCLFCMAYQSMPMRHTRYLIDGVLVDCPLGRIEEYLIAQTGVTPELLPVEDTDEIPA